MGGKEGRVEVIEQVSYDRNIEPSKPVSTEEVDTQSDLNVFNFWKEEILAMYTGRSSPKEGIFRRALQRSNLVTRYWNHFIWSEYGLALIEEELDRREIIVEKHKALHWNRARKRIENK